MTPRDPAFTVVVITRNRSATLAPTLDALLRQSLPSGETFEVVVVDNASDDDTCRIVDEYVTRYPAHVRYEREEQLGMTHARNRGIRAARGRYVAFIDDDCVVSAQWLSELYKTHTTFQADCVGGRYYVPLPFSTPPEWWPDRLEKTASFSFDLGDEPFQFGGPRVGAMDHPAPTNMSVHKSVFERVGPFDTSLAARVRPGATVGDIDFLERVRKAGLRCFYAPNATLEHRIAPDRFGRRQIFERIYYDAAGFAASDRRNRPFWTFILPRLIKKLLQITFCEFPLSRLHGSLHNERSFTRHWIRYLRNVGYLHGFRGTTRDTPPIPSRWSETEQRDSAAQSGSGRAGHT